MAKTRAEIDKDMMYRKIMPTAARPARGAQPEGGRAEMQENMTAAGTAGMTDEAPAMTMAAGNGAAGMRRRTAAGLQLPEPQDSILINLMEELVLSRLDGTLMRFNCCKCNKCKKDIAAIALNRLAPKYVVIDRGDTSKKTQAETEFGAEVTGALVQAIMLVKKEPRH